MYSYRKPQTVAKEDTILNTLLQLYCVLLPFEEAMALSFGSVQKILGLLIIVYIFLYYYDQLVIRKDSIPLIVWLLFLALSYFWSDSEANWRYFFQIYAVQVIFFLAVESIDMNMINLHKIRLSLIAGAVIAAGILIFMPSQSYLTDEGRRTVIMFGHTFDPNIVASIMNMGILSAIGEFITNQTGKGRLVYLACSGWILLGSLLTGSRGGLISLVAGLLFILLPKLKDKKERKWARRFIVLGAAITMFVITFLPENLINARFTKNTILGINELNAGSHNRYTIWEHALELFQKRMFFGYGCGNFMNSMATVYRSSASHNLYILLLTEGGIIGFIPFLLFIVSHIRRTVKTQNYIALGLLAAALVMGLSLDSITYKYFWFTLIYVVIAFNQTKLR